MKTWIPVLAGAAAVTLLFTAPDRVSAQAAKSKATKAVYKAPRAPNGAPDLQGSWFTNAGAAAWDVEEHPAGLGIVAGPSIILDTPDKKIPYQPWALAKRKDLIEHHAYADPQAHCYSSGVPRVTYAPFGFQILQAGNYVVINYENFHLYRFIPTDGRKHTALHDTFMGESRGRWEGDTLVVDVIGQNGLTWLDMASNFTSKNLHVVERYTRTGENELTYRATLTDASVYTRPWTIGFTISRNANPNYELMELACWEGEQDLIHYPEDQGAPKKK